MESPREPLIRTEGAPGLSSPVKPSPNGRRFSLRSTQNQNGGVAPTLKSLPRWKAGMLQRQIGQMNLRRRVRAFSLSDVYNEDLDERADPFGSPFNICKGNNRHGAGDAARRNISVLGETNDDKLAPSTLPEEQPSIGPPEAASLKSLRLDERNVRIIEQRAQTTATEFLPPCSRSDGDGVAEIAESSSSRNSRRGPRKQASSSDLDPTGYNPECSSLFPVPNTDTQLSLFEVKIESPVTNAVRNPSTNNEIDDSRNNLLDFTQLQIGEHESNSAIGKS